jgi:hypothetical protein
VVGRGDNMQIARSVEGMLAFSLLGLVLGGCVGFGVSVLIFG